MNQYRIGPKAASDLTTIVDYTVDRWGRERADIYADRLSECFQLLAGSPGLGRLWNRSIPGVRRFEHDSHVVFYREVKDGIEIIRILHWSMLPSRHVMHSGEQ